METAGEQHIFEVQVYLDDLDAEAVRFELYADVVNGGSPHWQEICLRQLAGSVGGHVYRGSVRVIAGLAVPLEEAHILWQR